jgi:hypothetical protein
VLKELCNLDSAACCEANDFRSCFLEILGSALMIHDNCVQISENNSHLLRWIVVRNISLSNVFLIGGTLNTEFANMVCSSTHLLQSWKKLNCSNIGESCREVLLSGAINCTGLNHLIITRCPVFDFPLIFEYTKRSPMLEHLCVYVEKSGLSMTDFNLGKLVEGCPLLKSVSLYDHKEISETGIRFVLTHCVHLTSFSFEGWGIGTSVKMTEMVDFKCKLLESVQIGFVTLNLSFWKSLLASCPLLKSVYMPGCFLVDEHGVKSALQLSDQTLEQLSVLKKLTDFCFLHDGVHSILNVFDAGVRRLISSCSQLTYIDLDGGVNLTDDLICFIAEFVGTRLKDLSLCGCTKITNRSLLALSTHCPDLGCLSINNCAGITDVGITVVVFGCKKLTLLCDAAHVTDRQIKELSVLFPTVLIHH